EVTMIVREKTFWNEVLTPAEATEIGLHIESHGIKLLFESELDEVLSDHSGKVRAIRTTKGKELECQLVGIATGVVPNIDFLKETGIEVDKGILVNEYLETNTPNIYAAGDCAQLREERRVGKERCFWQLRVSSRVRVDWAVTVLKCPWHIEGFRTGVT